MTRQLPALSVVVVADAIDALDDVVRQLGRQQLPGGIEVVAVSEFGTLAGGTQSTSTTLVVKEVASLTPLAAARAEGVRAASAPFVFLGEVHSCPCPGWATAVLAAHEGGAECVIPTFVNGNPGGTVSWASFVLAYGPYSEGAAESSPRSLPVYNCSWRRSTLMGFGEGLEQLLTPGSPLGQRLEQAGGRAVRSPRARVEHLNADRLAVLLAERFLLGRVVGAERRRRWPVRRRLLHIAASPLVGPLLAWRALRGLDVRGLPLATVPLMVLAGVVQSVGEAVGYAAGDSDSERRLSEYEFARSRSIG